MNEKQPSRMADLEIKYLLRIVTGLMAIVSFMGIRTLDRIDKLEDSYLSLREEVLLINSHLRIDRHLRQTRGIGGSETSLLDWPPLFALKPEPIDFPDKKPML